MAWLLENTYRHVNIALVNEMAIFCDEARHRPLGGHRRRWYQPFGFAPFTPGPGVGATASRSIRRTSPGGYAGSATRSGSWAGRRDQRPDAQVCRLRIADLLNDMHKSVGGSRILVLGLAYKRDLGDLRVTRTRPDPSAGEPRGPGPLARPARPRLQDRGLRGGGRRASSPPRSTGRRPTSWSCTPTTRRATPP